MTTMATKPQLAPPGPRMIFSSVELTNSFAGPSRMGPNCMTLPDTPTVFIVDETARQSLSPRARMCDFLEGRRRNDWRASRSSRPFGTEAYNASFQDEDAGIYR